MWYTKNNLRIAQNNSVQVNTNLKTSKTIPLYEKNKNNPAFKNFGKLNLNAEYLGALSNGEINLLFNDPNNLEKFNNMAQDTSKDYYISLQIDFNANQPFFQTFYISESNLEVPNNFIFDLFDSNKNILKFSFPTDGNGDFIPSFTYKLTINKKAKITSKRSLELNSNLNDVKVSEPSIFKKEKERIPSPGKIATFDSKIDPAEEKENFVLPTNTGIGVTISPISSNTPLVAQPGTAGPRSSSGIGISNIFPGLEGTKLISQTPKMPEAKIIKSEPVKYPKYNFKINVESLSKSTYNFKSPVEIYIDGVLQTRSHPNQTLYPLNYEYTPLIEGPHTLEARDTKTKLDPKSLITNKQTIIFEVNENQPIRIIKEEPRPGSF